MKLYYSDNHINIYNQDCRNMDTLPDNTVQCVVTSPPYWGLRKYSGEQELIWGDDSNCNHEWSDSIIKHDSMRYRGESTIVGNNHNIAIHPGSEVKHGYCNKCGAWKGAFGLEPTPDLYIQHTIEILREIKRVLRKDGVVFWNIGDGYYGGGNNKDGKPLVDSSQGRNKGTHDLGDITDNRVKHKVLKTKDLILMPFRIAIAAQEDGWWVRSVIIWSKTNPMPESVQDRPTESHEYILMLTKSARYYWDQDAVRRQYDGPLNRWGGDIVKRSGRKAIDMGGHDGEQRYGSTSMFREGSKVRPDDSGSNIRTIWEFPTTPYPDAHFAVFPEKLPETCIKAATPEVGCCSKCGKPYERILDKEPSKLNIRVRDAWKGRGTPDEGYSATSEEIENYMQYGNHPPQGTRSTIGWQPTCKCENAHKTPSLVLDPFAGAGTTLWVAKKLNRKAVGYEISEEYCQLALDRNRQQALLI